MYQHGKILKITFREKANVRLSAYVETNFQNVHEKYILKYIVVNFGKKGEKSGLENGVIANLFFLKTREIK